TGWRRPSSTRGRKGHELWLVSIDLDRFKFTNSRLGHKGGDRLLQIVAARLQAAVRPVDTVARLGGDEFALLLLPERGGAAPRTEQLQRVLDSLAAPLVLDGTELFLSASAGIAAFPTDSKEPGVLAERADMATVPRQGNEAANQYQFYTAAMNERLGERLQIESALRTALERREFELHYQPQVDSSSGRIMGMEALIRWRHPEMGMVAPNRFIPLAEETGQILAVGHWGAAPPPAASCATGRRTAGATCALPSTSRRASWPNRTSCKAWRRCWPIPAWRRAAWSWS
ncbi:diguanylate cyclase domain-containing protein, partial [Massilia eburnea]|uniref:diguanylate cyclase domain-containing protein n=1 Tax=Massilia eburnea TaxID=1776165 RepID=UPI003D6B438F